MNKTTYLHVVWITNVHGELYLWGWNGKECFDACEQDDADSVCRSLVIWETFATLNYLAPPYSCALIHRDMYRLARSLFPSVSLPFVIFSELSFLSLWRLPFSLLSPVCFLKQTQAHPLWWRQCSALKMASQKKNKKTGDNMKTTDKQANRTKVFFCCCYLQDVMLVLERMRSLKIDSFKQWQVRNAN